MTTPLTITMQRDICAVVLAGGRGQRMGGVDKGLQAFGVTSLVENAVLRLRAQSGGAPAHIGINANRNLERYAALGLPVWPDTLPDFAGPLAGFLSALEHNGQLPKACSLVLAVPCDSPLFPLDFLERMVYTLAQSGAAIAMACAPEADAQDHTRMRRQPVFCLMRAELTSNLRQFLDQGGRKIDAWIEQHPFAEVPFDREGDDARAFANANTLDELLRLSTP